MALAVDAASDVQSLDDPRGFKHIDEAARAGDDAHRFLAARRYYLARGTADKIDELLKEMKSAWADISSGAEGLERQGPGANAPEYELMQAGYDAVRRKLPPLIAEVEREFRQLVGG